MEGIVEVEVNRHHDYGEVPENVRRNESAAAPKEKRA